MGTVTSHEVESTLMNHCNFEHFGYVVEPNDYSFGANKHEQDQNWLDEAGSGYVRHPGWCRTNLLIKNIFFTRTRASALGPISGHDYTSSSNNGDAIPYIIPGFMPRPNGYLMVENVYVKLDYSMNSLSGRDGPRGAHENWY